MPALERSKKINLSELYPKLNKLCRLCRKPLTGRRTSWCSKKCGDEAWFQAQIRRGSSKEIRKALAKRDNEICAYCGVDCKLIKRVFNHAGKSLQQHEWKDRSLSREFMTMLYFGFKPFSHTWEADHIIEVIDGGDHILDNLQTLCIVCHKEKTKNAKRKRKGRS